MNELEEESVSSDGENYQDSGKQNDSNQYRDDYKKKVYKDSEKQRQQFIYERVTEMNQEEYEEFIHCRRTKVLNRGIKPVLDWL